MQFREEALHGMNREVHIFRNPDQMAEFAVSLWQNACTAHIQENTFFSAALSGGKTPVTFYRKLSEAVSLPWSKTQVLIVDERFVPYGSEHNNYHMINTTLLRHVEIPPRNIYAILTTEPSAEEAAARYEKDLLSFCKGSGSTLPRFDFMFLGIGVDGHTASLFPETPELEEVTRWAVSTSVHQGAEYRRITLTLPVINNSEQIAFLASGTSKARVLREIIESSDCSLPAARVRPVDGRLLFLLDRDAASELSRKTKPIDHS